MTSRGSSGHLGTVLVISDHADATADRVCAELAVRGVLVARFDAADFPTGLRLTATLADEESAGGSGWRGSLRGRTLDGRAVRVDLGDVRSVYYRRPTEFVVADGMSGPERRMAYDEARKGFGGVLQGLDAPWINDPVAAAHAEYKPVQLATAARCGLKIPPTIITNDPDAGAEWAEELGSPIVYKTVGGAWHPEDGVVKVIYTSPVTDPASLRDEALTYTAHLFQEHTAKLYEARAIVVGDRVWTVAIHTDTPSGRVDWRTSYDDHEYQVIDLPGPVQDGLLELHANLGLTYGAADLAYDADGDWVFYETNQAGEFGWLTDACGIPVAEAIADQLQKGRT